MEKVTIDYNRLCLELEKQGKTKADLSRDMTKNKNFVGLMEKNPDQPAEVERLMCLLLGLEQGSLIKQEEATGSQGEIKILENLHKEMREIHQAIIEYGELIEKIWSKVHANTLQLEKVKEDVKECAQVLKMTDYDKAVRFLKETLAGGRIDGAEVLRMALGRSVDIAINHDPDAILMHKTNHPNTLHLTEDIFRVDLKKYVKGRHVALMWASPDCTSHSKAKGGKPRERGLRILPWAVYKHTKAILPDIILMENVEEIQQWGPLDADGHPIKERRGEDYQKFITAMKSLGYVFDCRELVAADYGAPTTRKRWYAIFRRDGREIVWPAPTHFKDREPHWKACGDYIDWSDLGRSIFDRPKPLADATMKRIANGIRKYIIENPAPYIVKDGGKLFVSYLDKAYGGNYAGCGSDLSNPCSTITTVDHNRLVTAFLIQYHGETKAGESRGQLLTEPIKTIDTSNRYGLVTAFITKFYKSGIGQECDEPLHTITTSPGHFGLVNVVLDIEGEKYILNDIFLRMLKPEELKLMQGFPKDYIIDRDYRWKSYPITKQVARIGNSVVPIMAQKLVGANCPYLKVGERLPNFRTEEEGSGQIRFV